MPVVADWDKPNCSLWPKAIYFAYMLSLTQAKGKKTFDSALHSFEACKNDLVPFVPGLFF